MTPPTFRKSNPPVGSRPGTLAIPEGSPPPDIHLFQYGPDSVSETVISEVAEIAPLLRDDRITWVDVRGLGDEAVLWQLAENFGIHPLALELAVNVPQRATTVTYENHELVVARIPLVEEDGQISTPQVCFMIADRVLLTFQERYFGLFEPVRTRIRVGRGPIRKMGPDYLAYALIDCLVDRYYPVAQGLSERAEDMEDEVSVDPRDDTVARIHRLRRDLVVMRRVGWPQREAIGALILGESPFVDEGVKTYLRDVNAHIAQIMELVDSAHDLSIALLEIYLSTVSQRTNEIMKVLTLMASIFIPLTFMAGIYGMNFEFMPELQSRWAYPAVLVSMVLLAGGMVAYFRRRGWIGSRKRRSGEKRR